MNFKMVLSAANADVCLSMARILRGRYKNSIIIVGLVPDEVWPAKLYCNEVHIIPMASSPKYEQALIEILDQESPDFFLPFSEAELAYFVSHPTSLKRIKSKVIINPLPLLNIFLDKKLTADFLSEIGVSVPATYSLSELHEDYFPIIIKPRKSAGSKNISVIKNNLQLQACLSHIGVNADSYVAQAYIDAPDSEYTCALWRFGNSFQSCTLRRRLQGGMTGWAKVESIPAINSVLDKIGQSLEGNFFINVQLRLKENIPYVFEINPRFSSTVMMRHKIGFADFMWTIDWLEKKLLPDIWVPPVGTTLYRLSDECVIDAQGVMQ
jgi:carbamoyl-phosphate synthase large subunit